MKSMWIFVAKTFNSLIIFKLITCAYTLYTVVFAVHGEYDVAVYTFDRKLDQSLTVKNKNSW